MKTIASLWIGDSLGLIEKASILSFLNHGHKFVLYSYNEIKGVPDGAEVRDASEVLPCQNIICHRKTGSPALHSDLFRYALMNQTDTIWVDLDIIAIKRFDFDTDWVLGFESDSSVGSAVLRLPLESQTLHEAQKININTRGLPETINLSQRIRYFFKSLYYGKLTIDRWPYGSIGPALLTHHLNLSGEISHVMPQEVFYSIPFDNVSDILRPNKLSIASLPETAYGIHLWGKELRAQLDEIGGEIPKNCFLDELLLQINS